MRNLLTFLFVFFSVCIKAQIITTVAGIGVGGYSGDFGPATNAELNNVNALYSDPIGILYLSDNWNNRVRMIKGLGMIITIAGNGTSGYSGDGGPATAAELNNVGGVVTDHVGNVYIGDYYNNCVRKISFPSGIMSTIAGNGSSGYSGDGGPATAALLDHVYSVTLDTLNHLPPKLHSYPG